VTGSAAQPRRIQLSRRKGWRLPEGAVNVARHSSGHGKWGNPFRVGHKVICPGRWGTEANPYYGELPPGHYDGTGPDRAYEIRTVRDRADAVALYIAYYAKTTWSDPHHLNRIRHELGGRDLACWCPPGVPCHGDVLLAVANGRRPVTPDVVQPDGSRRIHVKRSCNGCGDSIGDVTDAEVAAVSEGHELPDARWECPRCSVILRTSPFRTADHAVAWMRAACVDLGARAAGAEQAEPSRLLLWLERHRAAAREDLSARMTAAAVMLGLPIPKETVDA
jgi:Domain of unknown function (DUF4326)